MLDRRSVTIRTGRRTDLPRFEALMFERPSPEVIGFAPDLERFRRYRRALFERSGERAGWANFLVAELADEVVGFVEIGTSEPTLTDLGSSALRGLGLVGSARAAWRSWPRARVEHHAPAGSLHLVELQVGVAWRNQGIGGILVAAAEKSARDGGHRQLSLTTATNNPARRLYDRHGFDVVATRTNNRYEQRTGAAGRVLMVKQL